MCRSTTPLFKPAIVPNIQLIIMETLRKKVHPSPIPIIFIIEVYMRYESIDLQTALLPNILLICLPWQPLLLSCQYA